MAYKKQGDSRDDKSSGLNRRTSKPYAGKSFSAPSNSENLGREGGFRKRLSTTTGTTGRSFGRAKGPFAEKRYDKPSAENNRFTSRDNGNASFSSKKTTDDTRRFQKTGGEGRPFKDRNFSPKPSSATNSGKPFRGRNTDGDRPSPSFGTRTDKPFKSRNTDGYQENRPERPTYKSSNSEGRPYQKDFSGKEKRYVKNDDTSSPEKKIMRSRNKPAETKSKDSGLIRLNRYIANAGICSRRKADELIEAGVVSVNGEVVSELGAKIDPIKDVIRYNGETLKREKMVYVLLNKPKDYITTTDDPQERRTVMQLVEKASRERIYPVGRLDRNTTGLLLLTNDGDLADKLSHPKNSITKIYNIELDKSLTQGDLNKIAYGIELEDGVIKPDAVSYVTGGSKREVGIQIHSGKNRIVRRIFEHLGYDVVKLDRVIYGSLTKKDLTRGRWRYLEEKEIIQLKHLMK